MGSNWNIFSTFAKIVSGGLAASSVNNGRRVKDHFINQDKNDLFAP